MSINQLEQLSDDELHRAGDELVAEYRRRNPGWQPDHVHCDQDPIECSYEALMYEVQALNERLMADNARLQELIRVRLQLLFGETPTPVSLKATFSVTQREEEYGQPDLEGVPRPEQAQGAT